jgi:hypothetical protein
MPMPAPTPVDALRQHSRAVVLTGRGGAVSRALQQTIDASEARCEILGHPLLALAELIHIERSPREADAPRPTLVVADREIDDLAPLFAAVRTHLPQLAIWVFEGDIAIEIQRGQLDARPAQLDARPAQLDARPAQLEARPAQLEARHTPTLRIAPAPPPEPTRATSAVAAGEHEAVSGSGDEDPPGPSGNTVTPEELEMLLDLFDGNGSNDGRSFGGPMR